MLPAGPPPLLEKIAGALLPPACREEVLGDLRERYTTPLQYLLLAIRVAPFVFASRVRRTTDAQLLLTQTILIYGSFLAGAWYSNRWLLTSRWGLLWPLIPTAANVLDLIFQAVWTGGSKWPRILVSSIALGIGVSFNVYSEFASVLLVRGLRMLTGSDRKFAHAAAPGVDRGTESVTANNTAESLLIASGSIALSAVFLAITGRQGGPQTMAAIVVFVTIIVFRNREGNSK
jgi:hypothetical protein